MRGTRPPTGDSPKSVGIIPAYAGNTDGVRTGFIPLGDHPRVCGEHLPSGNGWRSPKGSSPRMRGTPEWHRVDTYLIGIIPAYAGNTSTHVAHNFNPRDHPRVCGEHLLLQFLLLVCQGSSPRMRGTLLPDGKRLVQRGIIPAYAGNTESASRTI